MKRLALVIASLALGCTPDFRGLANRNPTDGGGGQPGVADGAVDIAARLSALPGVTLTSSADDVSANVYIYQLTLQQPVDHGQPGGASFAQHMTLYHHATTLPVVFQLAGYALDDENMSEVTSLVSGNQLTVEHRYFAGSRPSPVDWSRLTIEQAAADHHAIAQLFKSIYTGPWISTGESKGGMAALYHRRFYPDDVAGTVAFVTPLMLDQQSAQDVVFLDQVGTAACRQQLRDVQRQLLARRTDVEPIVMSHSPRSEFRQLSLDHAYELSVLELPFAFWQYRNASDCAGIPAADAPAADLATFLLATDPTAQFDDGELDHFLPYYYQSAAQIGFPTMPSFYLRDLLHASAGDIATEYLPSAVPAPMFDPQAMADIADWLATAASHMLFVYGENDPWTSYAAVLGDATDAHSYVVPGGNHDASVSALPATDRDAATTSIRGWAGLAPAPDATMHGAGPRPNHANVRHPPL
jgi:hypothetical protein